MWLKRGARQELTPLDIAEVLGLRGQRALQAACARRVALEVARVDLHAANGAGGAETNDGPVVARATPPLRFPAVAHVRGVAGHDQVVARTEEHVAARDDE